MDKHMFQEIVGSGVPLNIFQVLCGAHMAGGVYNDNNIKTHHV